MARPAGWQEDRSRWEPPRFCERDIAFPFLCLCPARSPRLQAYAQAAGSLQAGRGPVGAHGLARVAGHIVAKIVSQTGGPADGGIPGPGLVLLSDGIPFGYATLHPPMAYDTGYLKRIADYCLPRHSYHDDLMYTMYARRHGIDIVSLWHTLPQVVKFHNGAGGLIAERYKHHNDVAVMNEAFRVVT